MSKYSVTQKQYEEVTGENPSCIKDSARPVEQISWYDAVEFCNALSEKEGLTPYYSIDKENKDPNNACKCDCVKWTVKCDFTANGYSLPTEAEWEYVAQGGYYNSEESYCNLTSSSSRSFFCVSDCSGGEAVP